MDWRGSTGAYRRLRDYTHVTEAIECKSRADTSVPCSRMLTLGDKLNSCSRVHGRSFIRPHECNPLENRCLVSFFVPNPAGPLYAFLVSTVDHGTRTGEITLVLVPSNLASQRIGNLCASTFPFASVSVPVATWAD